MRQFLIIAIVFILPHSKSWSQINIDSTLIEEQKIIDSYIFSLDTLKVTETHLVGSLVFGAFEGICMYDQSNHIIYKIQFDFDSTTSKIFYFKNNKPIKIIDGQSEFYNSKKWVDKKGVIIKSEILDKLLILAKEGSDIVQKIVD